MEEVESRNLLRVVLLGSSDSRHLLVQDSELLPHQATLVYLPNFQQPRFVLFVFFRLLLVPGLHPSSQILRPRSIEQVSKLFWASANVSLVLFFSSRKPEQNGTFTRHRPTKCHFRGVEDRIAKIDDEVDRNSGHLFIGPSQLITHLSAEPNSLIHSRATGPRN